MRGWRWLPLGLLAATVGATSVGCFWLRRPYANDPLVRRRPAPHGEPASPPTAEPPARATCQLRPTGRTRGYGFTLTGGEKRV
jgi:hypothetical protein